MLGQATLDRYIEEVQRLSQQVAAGEKELTDLQALIDVALEESQGDATKEAFFLGERSFYQCQYKMALKHYMEAKELPLFQFFCYRACAFLFDHEQKTEKALDFASKALALVPNDWTTVALYSALLANVGRHDEAEVWRGKLHETGVPLARSGGEEGDAPSSVALGAEEFDELSQLFQSHDNDSDCCEVPPIAAAPELYSEEIMTAQLPRAASASQEEQILTRRLHGFQETQKRALKEYLTEASQRVSHQDYLFHVLDGWAESTAHGSLPAILSQRPRHTSGGYFLKWHGKGIAINPGAHFLEALHRQGFHIQDVDFVIVTKNTPSSFADVKAIYDLNSLVNGSQAEVHVIRYYLSQPAYQVLARVLKPHFKQERHSVHCLDLYLDSPEVESAALTDYIQLNYFPASHLSHSTNKNEDAAQAVLGIRLDLTGPGQGSPSGHAVKVGYASGAPWSPLLAEHLIGCDVLIAGVEDTSPEDWRRARYNTHSLGYFGTLSLLEEARPRLLLCCEFSGLEGDMRIELVRKLRADYAMHNARATTILPGDTGLSIDLTTLQVRCEASQSFVDPSVVHVVRADNQFGALNYLAPQCLI